MGKGLARWKTMLPRRRSSCRLAAVVISSGPSRMDPLIRARGQVVHAIKGVKQRGLAAAGGTDQRGDLVLGDGQRDIVEGAEAAVIKRHVRCADLHAVPVERRVGGIQSAATRRRSRWLRQLTPSLPTHATVRGLTAGYARVKRTEPQPCPNLNAPHSCSLRWRSRLRVKRFHMVSLSGPLPGSPPTERLFFAGLGRLHLLDSGTDGEKLATTCF